MVQQAEILEITQPSRLRKREQPAKLLNENEAFLYDEVSDLKTCYKRIYSDAIDAVTNCIKARFSQPGCRDRKKHRATYFKCYKWIRVSKPTKDVISDYSEDINHYRFPTQL